MIKKCKLLIEYFLKIGKKNLRPENAERAVEGRKTFDLESDLKENQEKTFMNTRNVSNNLPERQHGNL